MDDTDTKLLARYASHHAEDAFAEIARRHLDMVYSAALRQVRAPQLAEEVAQSTFIKLAGHAGQLAPDTILPAWLYQVTRREAIDVVRREASRQLREQIARTAVLLRYFENKSLRELLLGAPSFSCAHAPFPNFENFMRKFGSFRCPAAFN